MDLGIEGKVALVTAASRGLGKAVAHRLAAEGARVALCSRDGEAAEAAAETIRAETGAELIARACDVTDSGQVAELVGAVLQDFGGLHILVTNAGGPPAGMHEDFGPDDYRAAAELNLHSTIELIYAALPAMKEAGWGRILAVTSVAAKQPLPNLILSNTARAGVLGFVKTLSAQVAPLGITANSLCPGYTATERVEKLGEAFVAAGKGSLEDFREAIVRDIPLGRMATPEEFAAAAAFLASEAAASITGVALPVDGGLSRHLL